jgi:biopolymer transport protein TolR
MLVLLIIFMVTAPMLTAGVPIDLPDSRAEALKTDQKAITVSMDGEGRVFLDDPGPRAGRACRPAGRG